MTDASPALPASKVLKVPKKRGRKLTCGSFATRAELCAEVRWYYDNTTLSIEAIGHRFGISQGAAAKALDEALLPQA